MGGENKDQAIVGGRSWGYASEGQREQDELGCNSLNSISYFDSMLL